jgi:hypothetical protein
MNKEFVSYNQALALKELGFDEPCFGWFGSTGIFNDWDATDINAPTFSQAFRFFREKYHFVGTILGDGFNGELKGYYYSITEEGWINYYESIDDGKWYDTYEEAEDACLNKLIEIVKNKQ